MAKVLVSGSSIEISVTVTDAMTRAATGLTIAQIGMLRAVYEDRCGIDPATLTPEAIASLSKG